MAGHWTVLCGLGTANGALRSSEPCLRLAEDGWSGEEVEPRWDHDDDGGLVGVEQGW